MAARSEFGFCTVVARPLHAYRVQRRLLHTRNMCEAMKERFGLVRRPWGVFYLKDKITGTQTSLKTEIKVEAQRLLRAKNEAELQPALNLQIARAYLSATDADVRTRTWQKVMEIMGDSKKGATLVRWQSAIKDGAFDSIRNVSLLETRPEHQRFA